MKTPFDYAVEKLKKAIETWTPEVLRKAKSSSPAATGIPKDFVFQQKTRSGKDIHSTPEHSAHAHFTREDHLDAMYEHGKHAEELNNRKNVHPNLIAHHKMATEYHKNKYNTMP